MKEKLIKKAKNLIKKVRVKISSFKVSFNYSKKDIDIFQYKHSEGPAIEQKYINIKKLIHEYLSKEKIKILYFDVNNELAIKINPGDQPKWKYFSSIIIKNYINPKRLQIEYSDDVFIFKFKNIPDQGLDKELETFLSLLKKKYYTVCPSKKSQHILIKPTYSCNLDCKYCFDKPHRKKSKGNMSIKTVDRILKVASQSVSNLYLTFHGGEPTMIGLNWYKRVFKEVISKYPMLSFKFDLVTNGTLLDKDWIEFLKAHNITLHLSYNANYQTDLRCSNQSKLDEKKEMDLIKKIEKIIEDNNIGVIDVVTKHNYKDMVDIYEFYKQRKRAVAMNVLNENDQTKLNELEMSPEEYANEFLKLFRYWLYDKEGVYERSCANMLELVIGQNKNVVCDHYDCRGTRYTISPAGDIYPCDKYLPEKYRICSIYDIDEFSQLLEKERFRTYCDEVQERYDKHCSKCNYFFACFGGCNASVIQNNGDGKGIDDFACTALKLKFNGVYDILREVDSKSYENINPYAKEIMNEVNFFSVKEIYDILNELSPELKMEYDNNDLFNSSEYRVFSLVNYKEENLCKYNSKIKEIMKDNELSKDNILEKDERFIKIINELMNLK